MPEDSGCYVLTSFDGHILYIGQSKNLRRRFEEHLDNLAKTQATSQGRAVWFHWLLHKDLHLNALERGWLNEHAAVEGNWPILKTPLLPYKLYKRKWRALLLDSLNKGGIVFAVAGNAGKGNGVFVLGVGFQRRFGVEG